MLFLLPGGSLQVLYLLTLIRQDSCICNSGWQKIIVAVFSCRYGFLLPRVLSDHEDVLSICVAVFEHFGMASEMYQIGITKLFFRAGQVFPQYISPMPRMMFF